MASAPHEQSCAEEEKTEAKNAPESADPTIETAPAPKESKIEVAEVNVDKTLAKAKDILHTTKRI